jgi:Kelch motif protein
MRESFSPLSRTVLLLMALLLTLVAARPTRSLAGEGDGGAGGPLPPPAQFRPDLKHWNYPATLHHARAYLAAATDSSGRIYAIGGADENFNPLNTVERFDGAGWTDVPGNNDLPTARWALAAVTAPDGKVWTIGGDEGNPNNGPAKFSEKVEIFDPVTGIWTGGPPLHHPRRNLAAVVDHDGKIWAIGGRGPEGGQNQATVDWVEVYDTKLGGSWTDSASQDLPLGRTRLGAGVDRSGRVYAIGGNRCPSPAGDPLLSCAVPDVTSISSGTGWGSAPVLAPKREQVAGISGIDGSIYAVGGVPRLCDSSFPCLPYGVSVLEGRLWRELAGPPLTPVMAIGSAQDSSGVIYEIGGTDGTLVNGVSGTMKVFTSVATFDPNGP